MPKISCKISHDAAGNVIVDEGLAFKVLKIVDKGLTHGLGNNVPGQMCVEAAVAYASGEPHSDKPKCVDSNLRSYKIQLNDESGWNSAASRAAGLRRIAIAQLGSNGAFDNKMFLKLLLDPINAQTLAAAKKTLPKKLKKLVAAAKKDKQRALASTKKDLAKRIASAKKQMTLEIKRAKGAYKMRQKSIKATAALTVKQREADLKSLSTVKDLSAVRFIAGGHTFQKAHTVGDYADVLHSLNPKRSEESCLKEKAEAMVQVLKKMKIPGTKYLYLTEGKRKAKAKKKSK